MEAALCRPWFLWNCLVTDNEPGSIHTVVAKAYHDQQTKIRCNPCVAKFEKNSAKYLAKLP